MGTCRFLFCLALGLAMASASLFSQSVTLEWDPSPSGDVVGYFIYRSQTSGSGFKRLNAAPLTQTRYLDTNLQPGATYYYVCTSVGKGGLESGYSNQVSHHVPSSKEGEGSGAAAPGNQPPVAVKDWTTTERGAAVAIAVLQNDTDPEGDPLTLIRVTEPFHGQAKIVPGGRVVYTPETGYTGFDSFTYSVSDGRGGISTAAVSVAITVPLKDYRPEPDNPLSVTPAPLFFPAGLSTGSPHFENTFIGLGILNPEDGPEDIEIEARDALGAVVSGRRQFDSLPPRGQLAFLADQVSGDGEASYLRVGSIPEQAVGFFMLGDDSAVHRMDGVGGRLVSSRELFLPNVARRSGEETLVQVINPDLRYPVRVILEFHGQNGGLRARLERTIPRGGSLLETVSDSVPAYYQDRDGYLRIESDRPVLALGVVADPERLTGSAARAVQPVRSLYAPHFFVDAEGGDSVLRLVNAGVTPASVQIRLRDDDGGELARSSMTLGANTQATARLADLLIRPSSPGGLVDGTLEVHVEDGPPAPLIGSLTLVGVDGRSATELPLLVEGALETVIPHVAHTSDGSIFTGLALFNPATEPAVATLEAYTSDGAVAAVRGLLVPPGARVVDLLAGEAFFGPGFEQTGGHLRVTADEKVILFAIFGDGAGEFLSAIEAQPVETTD